MLHLGGISPGPHVVAVLITVAWNVLAWLTEVLVNDEEHGSGIIGNHFIIGGNELGDDTEVVKRAGSQYISDRDTAIYDRDIRH